MENINISLYMINKLKAFIKTYGEAELLTALTNYINTNYLYICRTKTFTKCLAINSINYIEIYGHTLMIHSSEGTFSKYGTLKREYDKLKNCNFVKCNQSLLVSVCKISKLSGRHLTLYTGETFTISQSCLNDVYSAYTNNKS